MKIRVAFFDAARTIAAVHVAPGLLERLLLGRLELDDFVCAVAEPGGGRRWVHDSTGRAVTSHRIIAALDRARSAAAAPATAST